MKKLISIVLMTLPLLSLANSFSSEMKKAMTQYESSASVKDFVLVSTVFAQIAKANPNQWEPAYYQAFCLLTAGFDSKEAGEKEAYLNKVETQIEDMLVKWENNAEIWTLKGMYLSARLMQDFRKAASLSPQISACAQHALAISPNNPRSLFLKIRNEIGIAQYMGTDLAPLCAEAAKALSEFNQFKVESEWSPQWGQDHLKRIVTTCK